MKELYLEPESYWYTKNIDILHLSQTPNNAEIETSLTAAVCFSHDIREYQIMKVTAPIQDF